MIDKGRCDDGFVWNPSICECKCDKLCEVGEYLNYANFKCRKKFIDKLVEKCDEDIDGNEVICNATLSGYKKACKSCTLYIMLLIIKFIIIMGINGVWFYFYWVSIFFIAFYSSFYWLSYRIDLR